MKSKGLAILLIGFFMTGCLVTRQQVRETVSPPRSQPLTPEQQQRASSEIKYQEVEQQTRELLGRIETLENSVNVLSAEKSGTQMERQTEKKSLDEKLKIYEEAITKLESQYLALAQKMEALQQANTARASTRESSASAPAKSSYDTAESEFGKKRWKEAIVAFEKYRSSNPTGKRYAEATYKIGASFHELGMKTEAQAFYAEVVEKFPKSDWAKKSNQRLKALK